MSTSDEENDPGCAARVPGPQQGWSWRGVSQGHGEEAALGAAAAAALCARECRRKLKAAAAESDSPFATPAFAQKLRDRVAARRLLQAAPPPPQPRALASWNSPLGKVYQFYPAMYQNELDLFDAYYGAADAPLWTDRVANVSAVKAWRLALTAAAADQSDSGVIVFRRGGGPSELALRPLCACRATGSASSNVGTTVRGSLQALEHCG